IIDGLTGAKIDGLHLGGCQRGRKAWFYCADPVPTSRQARELEAAVGIGEHARRGINFRRGGIVAEDPQVSAGDGRLCAVLDHLARNAACWPLWGLQGLCDQWGLWGQ